MIKRLITGLLIIACVVPPLVYGGWLLAILIGFIVIYGGIEVLSLSDHDQIWPIGIRPFIIGCLFILLLVPDTIAIPMLGMCILCFLSIPIFTDKFTARDAFLCVFYVVFFYLIAISFLGIHKENPLYIWLIIIATYLCDTAAYFTGYCFGKHKLNTRISPKKTIEGSVGGWIFGALGSFAFAYFFIGEAASSEMIAACLLLPISGQIGDLAFSAIKRCYGIKDFSDLLPGHGGVLDRLDSLIFNFLCFHMILVVIAL